MIARAIAEAGAEILIVPSCTESLAGYYRVRHACAARALENQIYVVQSPTVGDAPWSVAVNVNVGAAGFSRRLIRDSPAMASSRWAPSINHSGFTQLSISICSRKSGKTATC